MKKFNQYVNEYVIAGQSRQSMIGAKKTCPECEKSKSKEEFKKFGDREVCKSCHSDLSVAKREKYFADKSTNESKEQIDEISKETVQSYINKTVDPIHGMPRPGFKNLKTRMKGVERASKIVAKKKKTQFVGDGEHMKNVLQQRADARTKVDKIYQELRRKKEAQDKEGMKG